MKRTILYAYIALLIAVGLPFLANLGEKDAHAASGGSGEANPTPTAAVACVEMRPTKYVSAEL